jgi:hypothetical protein
MQIVEISKYYQLILSIGWNEIVEKQKKQREEKLEKLLHEIIKSPTPIVFSFEV